MPYEVIQSEAAKHAGVCHTESECEEIYAALEPKLKTRALEFIRSKITFADGEKIRSLIRQHGKQDWLWHLYDGENFGGPPCPHFSWGMAVRNLLRQHGFGEKELGVHNLDDIYIPLVAEAVAERIN